MTKRYSYDEAKKLLILNGINFPPDFDQWELAEANGRTIAHRAARYGLLPVSFNQWDLADKDGWTVAHVAAEHAHLPSTFNRWGIADNAGRTVAKVAFMAGHLSESEYAALVVEIGLNGLTEYTASML
jgi:hypothetical protein